VVRVLTIYAGTAYVIVELISNVSEPLQLPAWVPTLIIVLLAVDFPVVAIFSWIFDITPGGIRKTEDLQEAVAPYMAKVLMTRRRRSSRKKRTMLWV